MTQRANIFETQVRQEGGTPLIFETIPPRRDAGEEKVVAWCDRIVTALDSLPVTAVNIPEVRDESRDGERTFNYVKRMKPREFGALLRESFTRPIDLVINRVVVHRPVPQQKEWLANTYKLGIRNLVLVGGEAPWVKYPGPSVTEMAKLVTEEVNSHLSADARWLCGGITIPSRRLVDPEQDEPARLIAKAQAGIGFFTSQVIYESDHTCRLLWDYSELCQKMGEVPRRIFLSLAPVKEAKQVEFMRWLGVEIPPGVEAELLKNGDDVGKSSLEVCTCVFERVREFNDKLSLPIPLGLNISPMFRSCFDLGVELTNRVAQLT